MIFFENWKLRVEGQTIAQQFDHLTRTLTVTGDLPQGWEWVMMVEKVEGERTDCLPLEAMDGGIGLTLTAQHLADSGTYSVQLKGKKGEQVRHTNVINVYVETSLSGDVWWPEVPSHFSALEKRIEDAAASVKAYGLHPPVLGENGNWWLWNGENYEDAGYSPIDSLLAALPNGDEVSY